MALELRRIQELTSFDPGADVITRLIWLRAKASRIFGLGETAYLTHQLPRPCEVLVVWREGWHRGGVCLSEETRLHAAVSDVLALSDEDKAGCEIIHFADGDETAPKLLHYLVVYHPGKMRTLRQMVRGHRDLLAFIPALEATPGSRPAPPTRCMSSDRAKVAQSLADRFSQIGFEKPLSKEPMDAVAYELSMFRSPIDLRKNAKAPGVVVEDAWIAFSPAFTRHSLSFELANSDDIWSPPTVDARAQPDHPPCHRGNQVVLSVRFGDETPRADIPSVSPALTVHLA